MLRLLLVSLLFASSGPGCRTMRFWRSEPPKPAETEQPTPAENKPNEILQTAGKNQSEPPPEPKKIHRNEAPGPQKSPFDDAFQGL